MQICKCPASPLRPLRRLPSWVTLWDVVGESHGVGEEREASVKRLLQALLSVRIEGLTHNVPILRDVLTSREFVESSHHNGSLAQVIEDRNGYAPSPNGNGAMPNNGHSKNDREVAAAIAVAMAMAMKANSPSGAPAAQTSNVWRSYGRRAQLLSRTMGGSRGWR